MPIFYNEFKIGRKGDMRGILFTIAVFAVCFSICFAGQSPAGEFDPEVHLEKADEAVKMDPLHAMDISRSALMLLRGSGNEYLEIKGVLGYDPS